MKKYLLLSCLTLIIGVVSAQTPKATVNQQSDFSFISPQSDKWINQFERKQLKMVSILALTDAQKRSLDTMNDMYVTQRAAMFDDNTVKKAERKDDIQALRMERMKKFQQLLSPRQLAKWIELRKGQQKKVFKKK